jgi:ribosomal protein S18 acetylase RimI-like enzyme
VVVQSLVVDNSARISGAGKLLMINVEDWARRKGIKRFVLHTRVDRDDARAFYERIGYRKAATAHLMTKSIDAA